MGYLKSGIDINLLKRDVISKIAKDEKSTLWSLVTVFLVYLIIGIASVLFSLLIYQLFSSFFKTGSTLIPNQFFLRTIGFSLAQGLIYILIWPFILWIMVKLFKGKTNYISLIRTLGLSSVLAILSIIPLIGILAWMWSIVVSIFIVNETQKLSIGKSIAVVLIPGAILIVLAFIVFIIFAITMSKI